MTILEKRSNWFTQYQSIPAIGVSGIRDLVERTKLFRPADFRSASVLDVGCNTGAMCHWALSQGASSVAGIDYDTEAIRLARQYAEQAKIAAEFAVEDIDLPACWRSIPRAEVVLFLSIYLTKELSCKEAILANVASKAAKVMYFEGHANDTQDYFPETYVRDIVKWTDFANVEFLGRTDKPGERPLIRCTREPLSSASAIVRILDAMKKYNKIVVVGKSAVGKSALCDYLKTNVGTPTHAIYDDVVPPYPYEKFILFDWRGLEYVPDADCVFFVTCSESERQRRIDGQPYKDRLLRTAPGVPTCAKAVYTVQT